MWKIPLFDISYEIEEIDAVRNVLESGWLTMGDITKQFEKSLAHYLNCKYAFFFTMIFIKFHIV
ncbi:DegT/DnrJ/EryC1/StrS aminotransferase [Candidatus Magnetomorum sp. HK-1]|nr:DegT/DnrJ/EryC1/StrS aminotransferase [Candidatus Magnetomorum sp. HK-1]